MRLGRLQADLVAVEARRHLEPTTRPAAASADTVRDAAELLRPVPTLGGYDSLLAPLAATA